MKNYDEIFCGFGKCPLTKDYNGYTILVQYSPFEVGVLVGIIQKGSIRAYIERKLSEETIIIGTEVYNMFGCSKSSTEHKRFEETDKAVNDFYEELKMCVDGIELFVEQEVEIKKAQLLRNKELNPYICIKPYKSDEV